MTTERKKPGRPRKQPKYKPLDKYGITDKPLQKTNIIELVYENVIIFKKIFAFFKAMSSEKVQMNFQPDKITIQTTDHLETSIVNVDIDASKINHYYCSEPCVICLDSNNFKKIIQTLDKSHAAIIFYIVKAPVHQRKLTIIFKNIYLDIDEYRDLNILHHDVMKYPINSNINNYPIRFTLPSEYFKKMVTNVRNFTNILTIEKTNNSSLIFSYISTDKSIESKYKVNSEEKIKLFSDLSNKNDIFSASIQMDYIKPLSNAMLSESTHIAVNDTENILFYHSIDNKTVEITVSTQIIDYKKIL
jgi:hypothetical protein